MIGRVVAVAESRGMSVRDFGTPDRIAYVVALIVLFASWQRCRGARMTTSSLHQLDAAVTIVVATCWGMLGWGPAAAYPVWQAMPVTHTLIGRSVVVPSAARRTFWISPSAPTSPTW